MIDRRRDYRLDTDIDASCFLVEPSGRPGRRFDATLLDVSASGIRIEATEPLDEESRVLVEFTLGELVIAADGIVRRADRSGGVPCYGIAFTGLTREERSAIQERIVRAALGEDDGGEPDPHVRIDDEQRGALRGLHDALTGWAADDAA